MAELISCMEVLHGTQKAHLLVVTRDSLETQNIIAENVPTFVAIITLASHAKMV